MFYFGKNQRVFWRTDGNTRSASTLQLGQQDLTRQASFELNTAGIPVASLGFGFRNTFWVVAS